MAPGVFKSHELESGFLERGLYRGLFGEDSRGY